MTGDTIHDVAILGGGPSGAAVACRLARAGHAPLLVERERAPRHKVCGEFLSIEAQACLADIGIDLAALGGAPIRVVRLIHGSRVAEAALPFQGLGLTRRVLDEALLRRAEGLGATLLRGQAVRDVTPEGGTLRVALSGGGVIRARTAFLATGKHDLRRLRRAEARRGDDLIGFKTYHRLAPGPAARLHGAIEIVLFEGGYAGLQEVEGGLANLCLLVSRQVFHAAGRSWEGLLARLCEACPILADRLEGAAPLLDRPLATSGLPYGFVHRAEEGAPGNLFRVGDQAGVIHPFAGDGISIALYTGALAADAYLARGQGAGTFHAEMRGAVHGQIRLASALYGLSRSRLGRRALVEAARWAPRTLRAITARTRVPEAALGGIGVALLP